MFSSELGNINVDFLSQGEGVTAKLCLQKTWRSYLMDARIPIDLKQKHVFCAVHGEPFRDKWPTGYFIAMNVLLAWTLESPDFQQASNYSVANIVSTLEVTKPMCCWVPNDKLLELYQEPNLGIARKSFCSKCGMVRLGTRAKLSGEHYPHLCFECVLEFKP